MEVYIVIWEDRHSDTTAYPFTDKEKAISEAKRIAKEYAGDKRDYKEHDYCKDSGWLFYADYSCEGDHTRVVTAKMDKSL